MEGTNPANASVPSLHHEADLIFESFQRKASLFLNAFSLFARYKSSPPS